ncbi:hypothetical protein FRB96_005523 [Tulasnella sp. 330]|nr:hypothetical protein FRB96_005523 [Tulasnella sp. 330]KAG8869807.1 hypothetical protein FRB97_000726 [Tulasnella sp. 331]KAG8871372.1 hypothetical protein FRB98_000824 [Tulasnella sp. 332]
MLSFPVVLTIFLFVCNLGQTVCTIYTAQQGFMRHPEGAKAYFDLFDSRAIDPGWYTATDAWECISGHVFEILMLWRLHDLWPQNMLVMLLPITLTCFGTIECILILVRDIMPYELFKNPKLVPFKQDPTLALLANDMTLIFYLTGVICFRLWWVEREKRAVWALHGQVGPEHGTKSLFAFITYAFVQSGMFHSLTEAALILIILTHLDDCMFIMHSLVSRIVGISAVLLLLQLHLSDEKRDTHNNQLTPDASTTYSIPVFLANRTVESATSDGAETRETPLPDDSTDERANHTLWSATLDEPPDNCLMLSSMSINASDSSV